MTTIIERISLVTAAKKISIKELERKSGLSNGTLSSALKRDGSVGADNLEKIFYQLEGVSAHWLLTGEGEMLAAPINGHVQVVQGNGHVGQVTQHIGADPCAGYKAKVAELEKEVAYLQKINALLEAAKNNRINAMKTLSYQNHKPSSTPKPQGALLHQLLRLTRSLTRMRRKVYMTPSEQDEAMLHEMEKARLDPRKTSLEDGLRIIQAQIDAHRPRA